MSLVLERLGHCEDGHGEVGRFLDFDGSHMGFAVALLKARWARDQVSAAAIADAASPEELLRSALELVVFMAMAATTGRQAAAHSLTVSADRYERTDRPRVALLCRDLALAVEVTSTESRTLTVHLVDLEVALDLGASIITATAVHHGVSVEDQFTGYEQTLTMLAARQSA